MHPHRSNSSIFLGACLAFAFTMLALAASAFGQTESILYTFTGGSDGKTPVGSLIFDADGNLYGATFNGGSGGNGVVFELSPAIGGGWTETVLYSFLGGSDGALPVGGLTFDSAGNLYGTTVIGGSHNLGTVYELSPAASGGWTENILYSFAGGTDGTTPNGNLVFDAAGNLYGTTVGGGGTALLGTVFELSPAAGGGWTETVILTGSTLHGGEFDAGLVFDNDGNLYATAPLGGSSDAGSVYRLTHTSTGWHHGVIYNFLGTTDGASPRAGITFRPPGTLFGVAEGGGTFNFGTAFELTPGTGGAWNETTLHDFGAFPKDELCPTFALTIGTAGQLYGTNVAACSGGGTAFELVKTATGWKERILHSFTTGTDAGEPEGSVVLDGAGNLYGVGRNGGSFGAGAVFEIIP